MIKQIENTISMIDDVLSNMNRVSLAEEYPIVVLKEKTTTEHFLIHLATHLAYHIGQVNYHRRLLDN